jgi:hypothetical protein
MEASVQKRAKTFRTMKNMVSRSKTFGHVPRKDNIKAMESKAMLRFAALYSVFKRRTLNRNLKTHVYTSLIRLIPLYGAPKWGYETTSNMKKLEVM